MHFNFHLSGDESPEQSRRIANAVLALGGLLTPAKSTSVGEITVDVKVDTTNATAALDKLAALAGAKWVEEDAVTANAGESPSEHAARDEYLNGIMDRSEALLADAPPVPASPLAAMAEALRQKADGERLLPPIPSTLEVSNVVPSTDKAGLPWDERIHSSSRAINADGTWRYRKNVPDETKRDVEAELRGLVDGLVKAVNDILPPNADFSHGGVATVPPPVPMSGPEHVVPLVPTPPAPPVPTGALQRTYSDVVNLIMARKVQPDTYVAILGMSLPEFAKHVISAPNDATLMFDALDQASHT